MQMHKYKHFASQTGNRNSANLFWGGTAYSTLLFNYLYGTHSSERKGDFSFLTYNTLL